MGRRCIQPAGNLAARPDQLRHVEQWQWSAAQDPDRLGGNLPRCLEQNLGRSDGHDTRQSPTWEWRWALLRSQSQYHVAGVHRFGLTLAGHVDIPSGLDLPDLGCRFVARTAGPKARGEIETSTVFLAQQGSSRRRCHRFHGTPDLPSRRRLLVHHQNGEPMRPQPDRGAHSRRACTNDDSIERSHDATVGLPSSRSTHMSCSTATRQVCLDDAPSIIARQSKHTPIMQNAARGLP